MPKAPNKKIVEDATEALNSVRRQWMRRPGVTAVDVGFKIKGDEMTDDVALRVHVAQKRPAAELAASEVFNETGKTPKKIKGFPVDVIEAEYGPANMAVEAPMALDAEDDVIAGLERTTVFNPLLGGISCGNPRITSGTIGAIVFNRRSCQPMILSNWHVLAASASAAVGEDILQPGRSDGGTEVVARLTQMTLDSRMDAAVATLNGARNHTRDILGLGTITGTDDATLGMQVIKSGRSTGITRGVVDGVSLTVSIDYTDPGVVTLTNQIRIVPRPPWPAVNDEISIGGDSGSVWMNERTNRAIGLHFAGERDTAPASENAICSPIEPIAREFNFSFLPVLCPIRPFDPPVIDICQRFPGLCERIFRDPGFPFPRPLPDPPPFDRPVLDDPRILGGLVAMAMRQSSGGGGCGCGGGHGGQDDTALAQAIMLLAASLNQRR